MVGKVGNMSSRTTPLELAEPSALAAAMSGRDHSTRTVASITAALAEAAPSRYKPVSRALINDLCTGKRTSTHPLRAAAIERALGVPAGSFFAARGVQRPMDDGRAA